MSDYWCAKCDDTTVGWYRAKADHVCALCKEPCEDIVVVIHALQAEVGRTIIANTINGSLAQELAEVRAECDRLRGVIKQFNTDRFTCNCKGYNAPKQTKCFPWCRSHDGIKIPEGKK